MMYARSKPGHDKIVVCRPRLPREPQDWSKAAEFRSALLALSGSGNTSGASVAGSTPNFLAHHGTAPFSSKNPPLRPSSLSMTNRAIRRAGLSGGCVPVLLLRSVLVKPGAMQKIVTPSFLSSSAQWTVIAFKAVFEEP